MQQTKRSRARLAFAAVIVGLLGVVTLVLVLAVAGLVLTSRSSADTSPVSLLRPSSPLQAIETDRVDPALALTSLGGVPEEQVVAEAVNMARPETALATIMYDPRMSDKESAGSLLLVAQAFLAEGSPQKAAFSYQHAGAIATLSPGIPDTVRADVLVQAGEGLMSLDRDELALFQFDQAFVLAAGSPYLQAAHRRSIFERLQRNYISLGQREAARTSLNLSASPPSVGAGAGEDLVLPRPGSVALSEAAQEMETARWLAAQELAANIVDLGGQVPPSKVEALRLALLEEDRVKLPFYEEELARATQLSRRIDVTMAQIEWLSLKYRVARQGFGLSVVPTWEADAEQIRAELTKAYERLFAAYADLIVALPDPSTINLATAERLRAEVLAGELGRYPNYPKEQREQQLLDALTQLQTNADTSRNLVMSTDTVAGREMYRLILPQ